MADVASPIISFGIDMLPASSFGAGPVIDLLVDLGQSRSGSPIDSFLVDLGQSRGGSPIDNTQIDFQPVTRGAGPIASALADIGLGRATPIVSHLVDIGEGRGAPIADHRVSFIIQPPIGGPLCDHLVRYAPLITPLDPNAVNPPEQAIPVPSRLSSVGTGITDLSPGTFGIEFMGNTISGPGANN